MSNGLDFGTSRDQTPKHYLDSKAVAEAECEGRAGRSRKKTQESSLQITQVLSVRKPQGTRPVLDDMQDRMHNVHVPNIHIIEPHTHCTAALRSVWIACCHRMLAACPEVKALRKVPGKLTTLRQYAS